MGDFAEIMVFLCTLIGGAFDSFDSVYIDSWSLLDIFVSLEYMAITLWGIFQLIGTDNENKEA